MRSYGMRFCRWSGKRSHKFDPTTHQCQCGAWERGFAPEKEFVRPRAECQICERQQAVDSSGRLGHHGYKRPGWGFIEGDCFGQGHQPYPSTDALEDYLGALNSAIDRWNAALANLPSLMELPESYKPFRGPQRGQRLQVMIPKGTESRYDFESGHQFPSFQQLLDIEEHRLQRDIANGRKEVARVERRIQAAANLAIDATAP